MRRSKVQKIIEISSKHIHDKRNDIEAMKQRLPESTTIYLWNEISRACREIRNQKKDIKRSNLKVYY
jgi:hypothetical protein